ncbi:MAG: hypothetical protein HOQ28_12550 [Thermoleophilia bacterium]|nr:hypothetical protein [Thermoleophilia bacterium]
MGELLPYLPYDSGAMRSVASAVKNQATRLATVGSEVAGAGGSMTFEGPAGDRIRDELAAVGRHASKAGEGLTAAAGQLERAADDVDAQNAQIRQHNDKVLSDMSAFERKLVLENT